MKIRNPRYREAAAALFRGAPFLAELGIELQGVEPGRAEAHLEVKTVHLQQDGFVHAGVLATLADHTAGAAACTLLEADQFPLTTGFEVHFLRTALGNALRCHARVLKAGRSLTLVESEVHCCNEDGEELVCKAMVNIAVLPRE